MDSNISVLISEEALKKRIDELAEEISSDYKGKTVTMVCVLKGGVVFMVELAKALKIDVEMDFMDITSYGNAAVSSGVVTIKKDVADSLTDKHVLLVEDIIDTGLTLSRLIEHIKSKNPASFEMCSLLSKNERRIVEIDAKYVGFEIPDKFVVGYGLDYAQKYRNLSYVGVVDVEE